MKTILTRMKTLVQNNSQIAGAATTTLAYVRAVEVVHPDLDDTVFSVATLPKIVLVPVSTSESWQASGKKEAVNTVVAYLILSYHQRETSIMGDATRPAGHGKGIVDFVTDFLSVFRGHRLSTDGSIYLDKPIDISSVDYIAENLGENGHFIIAQVTMECVRLFDQATLPGNV